MSGQENKVGGGAGGWRWSGQAGWLSAGALAGAGLAVGLGAAVLFSSLVLAADPVNVRWNRGELPAVGGGARVAKPEAFAENWVGWDQTGVEYHLPYPGVLPDSPFYLVKMIRDRVGLWLTVDEQRRAERKLLYADKRLNAAVFLLNRGKEDIAVTTATKAEKYLEESVEQTIRLSEQGRDVKSWLLTLRKAVARYVEVLDEMQAAAHGKNRDVLLDMRAKVRGLGERVGWILARGD